MLEPIYSSLYLLRHLRKGYSGIKAEREKLEKLKSRFPNEYSEFVRFLALRGEIMQKGNPYSGHVSDWEKLLYLNNAGLDAKINKRMYSNFSAVAKDNVQKILSSELFGLDTIKEAVSLQLFCPDQLHILLIGDPGTGKSDILHAASEISPISSFGLGSGTSSAGLTVTQRGREVMPGILPMANGGIACIDELNLMKPQDRAGLYSSMSKGYVSYDKGGSHFQFPARCSILAAANPIGDKFGKNMRKQIPFDPALLTRFHLVFVLRQYSVEDFMKISKKVIEGRRAANQDYGFLMDYIKFSKSCLPSFSTAFEEQIEKFLYEVKKREKKYFVEITPRFVEGIIRLSKASARMRLSNTVEEADVDKAIRVVRASLESCTTA
ncbi:MAG: ATP-binding protein [archaeon]